MLWRFLQRHLLLQSTLDLASGVRAPDSKIADAVALADATSSRKYQLKAARLRGRWALAAGDADAAAAEANVALDYAVGMSVPSELWRSYAFLADAVAAQGEVDLAREHRLAADAVLAQIEAGLRDRAGRAGIQRFRAALRAPA
jgi:hypothetical protein